MTRQDSFYVRLLEQEVALLRRLAAVEMVYPGPDRGRAERALGSYFARLGLAPRPVFWAADAREGYELADEREIAAARAEVSTAFTKSGQNTGPSSHGWTAAWTISNAHRWEWIKRIIGAERPGGAGAKWEGVRDALNNAVRATAACEIYRHSHTTTEGSGGPSGHDSIWLPFVDAYEAGLWLFWIQRREIIAVPRPSLHLKGDTLHRDGGPAIDWPGGAGHYFLNGVEVPREIAETPGHLLDPRLVLETTNAEVRREIVRKVGVERVCEGLGAECVDRQGDYELLLLDLRDGREKRPYLKMRNPSIGVWHVEGVAPHCRTVREALAWRNGTDVPPSVLT